MTLMYWLRMTATTRTHTQKKHIHIYKWQKKTKRLMLIKSDVFCVNWKRAISKWDLSLLIKYLFYANAFYFEPVALHWFASILQIVVHVCICVCAERQAFRWNQVNCAVDGDPFKENFKKNWVEMPNKCYQRSKQLFVLYMLKKRCFFSPALKTQDGFSKWTAIIWQGNYSENSIFSAQFLSFYLF